jgi:hypothetical protein
VKRSGDPEQPGLHTKFELSQKYIARFCLKTKTKQEKKKREREIAPPREETQNSRMITSHQVLRFVLFPWEVLAYGLVSPPQL